MTTRHPTLAILLSLLAPLAARAEGSDKPASTTEQGGATAQPAAPAPAPVPPPTPSAKPPAVTWELGGWLVLNSWYDDGAFNASDLPRYATPVKKEKAMGMSARQSRLRAGIGVPDDGGLLGGAVLKGFVEVDFVGGYASTADDSAPLLRLRHAYVTATWKDLGNFTILLGQTADVFHGPLVPATLAHLATPRFAGAGYLYRRAPMIRLSGEVGKDLAVVYQVAAISPATSTGYRAATPDLEGRLALLLRGSSPVKGELGLGGRFAREKWQLTGKAGTPAPNQTVKSQGVAVDLKIDAGYVALIGGAFAGENLDVENSLFGVRTADNGTAGKYTSVKSIPTKGGWGQLQVVPVKPLMLVAGAGVELPRKKMLPATIAAGVPAIDRSLQISGGVLVNLTSKLRVGLEVTHYEAHGVDKKTSRADQVELSSLLAL
jgi:hypothetical protein